MSLKMAEDLYLNKSYEAAYAAFGRLFEGIPSSEDDLLRDFLLLRTAQCIEKKPDLDYAGQLFRTASESKSLPVRTIANYHLCLIDLSAGRYLKARTTAYKALATVGCLSFDWQWSLSLERNCHFLIAEAVTRNVLSLCGADPPRLAVFGEAGKDVPVNLWPHIAPADPFAGLNESELRKVLGDGAKQLNQGVLSPQITRVEGTAAPARWMVSCAGPSLEELVSAVAIQAGGDVRWLDQAAGKSAEPAEGVRNRAVFLYMPAATARQVAAVAAGSVGLIADFDHTAAGMIITDPAVYSTLSEHISLLTDHAISLWQQFLLAYFDDERLPNAHLALAMLNTQKGRTPEAISEYKLIANRFSNASVAPFAMFKSSRLKAGIRDFSGAREDLKQLIDLYPDSELTGQAYLSLAQTTHSAGLYEEAARLYRKVYSLGLSSQAEAAASLGAGRCSFELKDYRAAVKWLSQYIRIVNEQARTKSPATQDTPVATAELNSAYYAIGEAYLEMGDLPAACQAFNQTLVATLPKEKYVQVVTALVETQIQRQDYVGALRMLENIHPISFSQEQSAQLAVLRSTILRQMGLTGEAITILQDKAKYLTEPQQKAVVILELAECLIDSGDLEAARKNLAEVLGLAKPGDLAEKATVELADVCLRLGEASQTVSLCTRVLETTESPQLKQRVACLLADAHNKEKNYDKAALALLGRLNRNEPVHETPVIKQQEKVEQAQTGNK